MKIEGTRCPHSNGYKIKTTVLNQKFNIRHIVDFVVDTGCSTTTINLCDALRLRLVSMHFFHPIEFSFILNNVHKLPYGNPSITASGMIDNILLINTQIIFPIPPNSVFIEKLKHVSISFPKTNMENFGDLNRIPSLLGMDIIKNYKLEFTEDKIILDR